VSETLKKKRFGFSRRSVLKATAAGIVTVAAGALDEDDAEASEGGEAEPRRLRVTRHRVPWKGAERKFRVAQLTDIHVGGAVPNHYLDRVAELVWRAKADLVVMTGDYVNHSLSHVDRLQRFVSLLPKPLIATLGNHDHWSGADGVIEAIRSGGGEVLQNDSVVYEKDGFSLPIAGIDDGFTRHDNVTRAFKHIRQPDRTLVLNHFPNTADKIMEHGAALILSGHTHGGQFHVPAVTQVLQRVVGNKYVAGWFELGDSKLYVSAGIGASIFGFRAGKPALPEVALFDLMPEPKAA
jgi:predicted MPP superfamily phosphohydrolase